MRLLKKIIISFAVFAFWILIWQGAALAVGNELILPSPITTARRLLALASDKEFYLLTLLSLLRIFAGIIISVLTAIPMAALCSKFKIADRLFAPAVSLMRSVPVVSFILIAIFLIDRRVIPTLITFVMIFPVLYENVREGIACVSSELAEMSEVFGLSHRLRIKRIYTPAVKPFFFSALCTSIGLAVKAGIAAEVVAYIPLSVGQKLSDAKSFMEPADLLAWTVVIVLLSLALEKLLRTIISASGMRRRHG